MSLESRYDRVDPRYDRVDTVDGDFPPWAHLRLWSLDIAGHYVSRGGVGAYGYLPLSFLPSGDTEYEPATFTFGCIELGALFARQLRSWVDVVIYSGVALPTADLQRPNLVEVTLVDASRLPGPSLSAGASTTFKYGPLFLRLDVGFDYRVEIATQQRSISPLLRLAAGGGIQTTHATYTLETTNASYDAGWSHFYSEVDRSTATIGVRLDTVTLRPGLGVMVGRVRQTAEPEARLLALLLSVTVHSLEW